MSEGGHPPRRADLIANSPSSSFYAHISANIIHTAVNYLLQNSMQTMQGVYSFMRVHILLLECNNRLCNHTIFTGLTVGLMVNLSTQVSVLGGALEGSIFSTSRNSQLLLTCIHFTLQRMQQKFERTSEQVLPIETLKKQSGQWVIQLPRAHPGLEGLFWVDRPILKLFFSYVFSVFVRTSLGTMVTHVTEGEMFSYVQVIYIALFKYIFYNCCLCFIKNVHEIYGF